MIPVLIESALRAMVVALTVGAGLRLLRVRIDAERDQRPGQDDAEQQERDRDALHQHEPPGKPGIHLGAARSA